jgi:uncharacterized LabA/DUF88 family protein
MRCAIFIDGAYLEFVQRKEFAKAGIDFGKFAGELVARVRGSSPGSPIDHLRTYYYHALPWKHDHNPTEDQLTRYNNKKHFFDTLEKTAPRFEVKLGRTQRIIDPDTKSETFQQKGVDVLLAVDLAALSASKDIQYAVLVSSDSDLAPAVYAAKASGCVVFLADGEHTSASDELRLACDERIIIGKELVTKVKL